MRNVSYPFCLQLIYVNRLLFLFDSVLCAMYGGHYAIHNLLHSNCDQDIYEKVIAVVLSNV